MERKIGEIFEVNGVKYKCIKPAFFYCEDCCFYNKQLCTEHTCCGAYREDGKDVMFKEIKEL